MTAPAAEPMDPNTTLICLVRHGETQWNADRRIQGQLDPPLNDKGIAQSESTARALANEAFTAIYSSDLQRARCTAELIAQHHPAPINLREDLRERRYGKLQGLTLTEIETRFPGEFAHFQNRHLDEEFDGGESLRQFHLRVSAALNSVAIQQNGKRVLVVAHGGVLDIAYRLATGRDLFSHRDFTISNAAVSWISHSASGWKLLSWNVAPTMSLDELPG
ncbi:MAG: histidine phosphatase family protein [Gammaproteobacteria bacterium]